MNGLLEKYAISISDGHNEDWHYYKTESQYQYAFERFKETESDVHGYILNENREYEVIQSHWDGE
jgi:hypothetical protein